MENRGGGTEVDLEGVVMGRGEWESENAMGRRKCTGNFETGLICHLICSPEYLPGEHAGETTPNQLAYRKHVSPPHNKPAGKKSKKREKPIATQFSVYTYIYIYTHTQLGNYL